MLLFFCLSANGLQGVWRMCEVPDACWVCGGTTARKAEARMGVDERMKAEALKREGRGGSGSGSGSVRAEAESGKRKAGKHAVQPVHTFFAYGGRG